MNLLTKSTPTVTGNSEAFLLGNGASEFLIDPVQAATQSIELFPQKCSISPTLILLGSVPTIEATNDAPGFIDTLRHDIDDVIENLMGFLARINIIVHKVVIHKMSAMSTKRLVVSPWRLRRRRQPMGFQL